MNFEKESEGLDLSQQQSIANITQESQGREEQDISQEKYEKLIMLPRHFSRKERERIRQAEAKILKLKKY